MRARRELTSTVAVNSTQSPWIFPSLRSRRAARGRARGQLRDLRLTGAAIDRRVATGRLHVVHCVVHAVGHAVLG
jgi:hypothetical protein